MQTTQNCPSCGKPLAPSAPKGLCQECLLKAGFPTGTQSQAENPKARFLAPTIEELAAKFPQLGILELVGSGGMGAVYKVRQKQLGRTVALKILPPGIGDQSAFAERFTREARALAALNHPNIVTLYEFGQADGLFFFLMEYVDGVNLRQLLAAGRVAPREALAIVPQICDALQYAHDQGIVHRDIKPENILLDRKGRVKVADFGVARLMATQVENAPDVAANSVTTASLTDAGKIVGTPQYMAPEQRQRPGETDHRADIYSLGVVIYQMLTGELPDVRMEPPSKKVLLDVRLDQIVLRALEKEPERRYQQVSEIKTSVETIATTRAEDLVVPEPVAQISPAPGNKLNQPTASAAAAGSINLKFEWIVGTRVVQDARFRQISEIPKPGQADPVKSHFCMGYKCQYSVLKQTPEGGPVVEMEFLGLWFGGKTGSYIWVYDSEQDLASEKPNMLTDLFRKIVGAKIRYLLDATQKVIRMEGATDLIHRINSGEQPKALADIRNIFNEVFLENLCAEQPSSLGRTVQPGETWSAQVERRISPSSTIVSELNFKFRDWEQCGRRNCARIEFEGVLQAKAKPETQAGPIWPTVEMVGNDNTTAGVSWFDPELRRPIESIVTNDRIVVSAQESSLPIRRHDFITMKVLSFEYI